MGDSEELSRASIPAVEAIKPAALEALASGRARSLESFEHETAKRLGLSSKQRAYRIGGSATALFSNRFEKARSELHREGLIEYPTRGKVRLTEAGRSAEGEKPAASVGDAPATADEPAATVPIASSSEPYEPGSFEGGIVAFPSEKKSAAQLRPWLPLALAVVGLLLCFTGTFALLGVACGIGSFGLFLHDRKSSSDAGSLKLAAPRATLAMGACSVLLGIVIMAGGAASGGNHADVQQPPDPALEQQEPKAAEEPEEHELSFVVEADGEGEVPASVKVRVTGTQKDGAKVSDTREAAVGKTYVLPYPAGSYVFDVDASSLAAGDVLFKAERVSCSFDGAEDRTVRISVAQDVEAMEKAQAEKAAQEEAEQRAAEEAAAAEAAAAAAAEEEAAAAAAAEQEAAAAAAAASGGGGSGGDAVYITNTGEKYHRDGCRYLKKSKIPVSRSDALAQGYDACSVCNP